MAGRRRKAIAKDYDELIAKEKETLENVTKD